MEDTSKFLMVGIVIAFLVCHDLLAVIIYDVLAWFKGWPSVSAHIRASWLSWPVGIMACLVIGGIILTHFVNWSHPGQ